MYVDGNGTILDVCGDSLHPQNDKTLVIYLADTSLNNLAEYECLAVALSSCTIDA